ncbi:uncharacterized protein PADG_05008 [Paracoccidioides brasiliensis Pb18]|uniref:tRNA-splicing endonuclease subunit Sen54 N-terminal domain-containing protein n=1 Tax=Paracoccidioides brasiliensis (strain Pb18) TaxID=502780 RepID=C1GBK7_PARBD|nr:uncharacterized protein PADG_05008 [Paracoccidioides brasiliensis Pb18]EEH48929.2 hypothetical protein PADG_05008 [Paracoccidioides brasiliensis Pb18]
MADADEDALIQPTSAQDQTTHIDQDLSDETQDFRFLNSLSLLPDPSQPASLPRRGEKDFEPNPTLRQADVLAASRDAMHNALAYPRLHNPKTRVVGIYCPTGLLRPARNPTGGGSRADKDNSSDENVAKEGKDVGVEESKEKKKDKERDTERYAPPRKKPPPPHGIGNGTCVCVPSPRGQHFRTVGRSDHWNRVWLLPEEALYLLERGSLDIRWPAPAGEHEHAGEGRGNRRDEEVEDVDGGIPMSLQGAYACLIGRGGLTLERYIVYAGLRRGGYTVIRAPSWDDGPVEQALSSTTSGIETHTHPEERGGGGLINLLSRFFNSIYKSIPTGCLAHGPVIGLGIHRNYHDIYRALSIIPTHNPTHPDPPQPPQTNPPYRLAYHIYKPSTPFRKSTPGTPDFRLAVINSRTNPTLPSLQDLSALLESTPLDPPRGGKMERLMYMRLRHGWRNVILAVVDQGVVSFLRVADAGFVGVRIYEEKQCGSRNKVGRSRGATGGGGQKGNGGGRT